MLSLLVIPAATRKEKSVVHEIQITGQKPLQFRTGDNPCKVLRRYCKEVVPKGTPPDACFQQLHQHATVQLAKRWEVVSEELKIDETFFIDCEHLKVIKEDFSDSPTPATLRNSSGLVREMLQLLDRARKRDAQALSEFNAKRYEYDLTDWERWKLYKAALMMLPSNLFIVDQFGLCLLYAGYELEARKFFQNAVDRGLWGTPLQRPVSKYVPNLTAIPWHNKEDYPFIKILEKGAADIKEEFETNLKERPHLFTGEMENLHVGGDWFELRLKSSGHGLTDHTQYFPKTMSVIKQSGQEFTSIKFSAIRPGTHIRVHTGPTNERLRIHLTLLHSGGAKIRVGTNWHTWEEGKAIIFDDSFEHEVLNTGSQLRAILILDIWHPELPLDQRILH